MRNDALEKKNIYYLSGEIDSESAKHLIEYLLEKNACSKPSTVLHLVINSPGGDLEEAFAIVDVMRGIGPKVYTYGIGKLQSAATVILIPGTKRFVTETCSIMTHTYSSEVSGSSHNITGAMVDIKLASERMLAHYLNFSCGKISSAKIKKHILTSDDKYHTPQEFMSYGMVDEIIPCLQFK